MEETKHVLSIVCDDHSGVLLRIISLFSRRGYSIESISAGSTESPDIYRITIVTTGTKDAIIQISNQLQKVHEVREVNVLRQSDAVLREHVLICAGTSEETCASLIQVANLFHAKIVSVNQQSLVLELTGEPRKIDAFIQLMKPYGIKRMMRSGLSALERD